MFKKRNRRQRPKFASGNVFEINKYSIKCLLFKMFWQVLVNIIGHIRFLTMTNEDFANSPAMSGILTQEESFAILMNISFRDKCPSDKFWNGLYLHVPSRDLLLTRLFLYCQKLFSYRMPFYTNKLFLVYHGCTSASTCPLSACGGPSWMEKV